MLTHVGRRSGRRYRTPLFVFPSRDGGYVFGLAYRGDLDWVRNVRAAGNAELRTRRQTVQLAHPRLTRLDTHPDAPWFHRCIFAAIGVHDFLEMSIDQR